MKFSIHPVTPYQQNCSLIWCEVTGQAVLVDPGGDMDLLVKAVAHQGVRLERLLLTHGHLDHVGAAQALSRHYGVPILGPHVADAYWLEKLPEQAQMFGFPPASAFTPDQWLEEGGRIQIGAGSLEVIHCPGHTPGHVVFVNRRDRLVWVGDVLFVGSIGRTDLPGGSMHELVHGIRTKLFPLGDDMDFVPGHGAMGNLGRERLHNPYVGIQADMESG
ncbi:MAG TPA: MBL fold metallo-hydrolase [Thiobacillaceae bacterium]|nr:MBL fold metallo-hydrolase [Thiobacillaceae bacterium]HNU63181.1 MBL fold metallo-hydrolase [Thiobacillaceae bacterium]